VPLMLFFALLSGKHLHFQITEALSVFSSRAQRKIMYFIDVFLAQVTGFFQGQLVIAVIMGVLFAIGFSLIGLKGGILIGLILGLLNIVPFLGTLIGLLIALPWAYMQPSGGFQLLGLTLIVFTIVQLVESWLLTPKIMANRSGLHPALVVISVFFWGTAFGGITGMILAVPLTAFLVAAWTQAKPVLTHSMKSDHEASRIETPAGTVQTSTFKDSETTSPEHIV
jgi:predicted PurR-regulated permease PerM